MIWSISWKNVWRSRVRSIVIIAAIIIGLTGGILSVAIFKGMTETRTSQMINNEISHIQIHDKLFDDNYEPNRIVYNVDKIEEKILSFDNDIKISKRLKAFCYATTSRGKGGMIVNGVTPEEEKQVTMIHEFVHNGYGDYLKNATDRKIFISTKTAENLKLDFYEFDSVKVEEFKLMLPPEMHPQLDSLTGTDYRTKKRLLQKLIAIYGVENTDIHKKKFFSHFRKYKRNSKITLRFLDVNLETVSYGFKIAGIYKTSNSTFDGMNAYIGFDIMKEIMSMPDNAVHEIVMRAENKESASVTTQKLKSALPDLKVEDWAEIKPEIKMQSEMMDVSMLIIIIIILLALGFGIINTMLMAILERVKEFGMLMAIGMSRLRVFLMVMLETVFLTLTGGVIGIAISIGLIMILQNTGIDISSLAEGMEAMGYSAILYPSISVEFYIEVVMLVIFTGIVSSIYPAIKALKLKPATAIRSL